MRRREFLLSGSALLVGSAAARPASEDIYARLVRANDALVPALLEKQEQRPAHPWLGGLPDAYGIHTAGGTAHLFKTLASAYCAPESRYHEVKELLPRLELAARYLLAAQHGDGTIDLHTTNFHSPPDTAFVVEPLAAAVTVLRGKPSAPVTSILKRMERFLLAAGGAMAVGGIHTPNHRWVVCASLARVNALYPDPKYVARIDDWLGEGIDIDADGQYTERSTAIYSPVVDSSLLTVARLLNRPQLLEPVRRNLTMTLYYLHADGEVATEGSRRQDQYARGSTAGYHIPYRYLALREGQKLHATMARLIEEKNGDGLAGNLVYFLEEPLLRGALPAGQDLPDDYLRHFSQSGLVRIRRKAASATLLTDNATFFSFHKGSAALQALRFASAFFGKGQFQSSSLQLQANRFELRQSLTGPYYQPLPAELRRADGDWNKTSRDLRRQTEVQHLESRATISERSGAFDIEIDIRGCDRVPVALELAFRRGGTLTGVTPVAGIPEAFVLQDGMGRYEFEGHSIEFGPGQAEHQWTQLRGALPKLDALCIYLTGFTPYRRRLTIS